MALRSDDRGISNVVGATLIFGFLVISLALYQATVVPSQNEQVEFDHSQAVQRDVIDVRNAILETKEEGYDGFVSVTLGTSYPTRTIAINPPPVTGNLRTTENRSFAIRDGSGSLVTDNVCPGAAQTRFLVYEPTYHEYASGPDVVYENSVVYEAFGSGNVLDSGQTIVQGNEINVIPLQGNYSASGTRTVSFESKAGLLDSTKVDHPEIELPTRLTESDWEDLLDGEVDPGNVTVANGNVTIAPDGEFTVNCGPVGADSVPTSGARRDVAADINPAGPGDVVLKNSTFVDKTRGVVDVYFNNTATASTNVTTAKLNFYFDGSGKNPQSDVIMLEPTTLTQVAHLIVGGSRVTLSPEVAFPGDRVTAIRLDFDKKVQDGDFFILKLTYENGKTGTYFVSPQP